MKTSRVGRPKGENVGNANRRRKQLIDAAIQSIVEHGLSATTLATVAKASGLSQGTAVFYFKNKQSLLYEAFRSRLDEYRKTWTDTLSDVGPDPVDQITALVFASMDPKLLTQHDIAFWNSFWPAASRHADLNEIYEQFDDERQAVLLSLCDDAREYMAKTIWTPKTVAQTLETVVEGVWIRLYYSPSHMTAEDARLAAGTLLSTIFPTRAADIMKLAKQPVNDN
ncbi:MAG: TetR family transcriptional regulator C-terminal domain-containing protein [Alphaproteobacteria bacterium]